MPTLDLLLILTAVTGAIGAAASTITAYVVLRKQTSENKPYKPLPVDDRVSTAKGEFIVPGAFSPDKASLTVARLG